MFDKKRTLAGAIFLYVLGIAVVVLFFFQSFKDTAAMIIYWVMPAMCFGAAAFLTVMYVKIKKREAAENPANREKIYEAAVRKYNSGDVSGIEIKLTEQGDFVFVGKFDLGELGTVGFDKIRISVDVDALKHIYGDGLTDDKALKLVTDTINGFRDKIKKHSHALKNHFLAGMIEETNMSGTGFWENYRLREDEYDDEKCSELFDAWYEKVFEGYRSSSDGKSICDERSVDIEAELKKNFPFFDCEKLLASIELEHLTFSSGSVSIQLSDATNEVFCGAYDEFDTELTPYDWHNF